LHGSYYIRDLGSSGVAKLLRPTHFWGAFCRSRQRRRTSPNIPDESVEDMARPRTTSRFFHSTSHIILLSILLRLVLIAYGIYHDAHSPLKYTDVDYYVFTDAAQFMHQGKSPYLRETYRYTPILAWMLIPTAWPGCFSWGKLMFALGDVAAGWIMILILRQRGMNHSRSLKYALIWLLNPMVPQTGLPRSHSVGCSNFNEGELRRTPRIYDLPPHILDSTRTVIVGRLTSGFRSAL
jgi:hypothetical protein